MILNFIRYKEYNYTSIINNSSGTCSNNYYNGIQSRDFFSELLEESNYHCYYCGQSLKTNNNDGIYFEKEHIINKKQNNKINKALNKCKYNLIPICKTCNSKKLYIDVSNKFFIEMKSLEINCQKKPTCNFNKCKALMEIENFNPFSSNIEFDIVHKFYFGDDKYISQFDLNKRTSTIFSSIFDSLYNVTSDFRGGGYLNHIKKFSNNVLDDELIDFLNEVNLINDYGTLKINKINNLIETITILEEFE